MEAFTALLGAGLLIAGRRFGINYGKDFVINAADSLGLLSADHYIAKAMECEDLDSSIEFMMKALRRNPIHSGALNWRELLEANVDGKIKNLLALKNNNENAVAKNNVEVSSIKRALSAISDDVTRFEKSRLQNAVKFALVFFIPVLVLLSVFFFGFAPSRDLPASWTRQAGTALLPVLSIAAASFFLPVFSAYAVTSIKIASLKSNMSEHESRVRTLHAQNERLVSELSSITEGIAHYTKRKEFLSVCERYLHDFQASAREKTG